jgi:hypothetical protein
VIPAACASTPIENRKNGVQFNQAAAKEIKEARARRLIQFARRPGFSFHHPITLLNHESYPP